MFWHDSACQAIIGVFGIIVVTCFAVGVGYVVGRISALRK